LPSVQASTLIVIMWREGGREMLLCHVTRPRYQRHHDDGHHCASTSLCASRRVQVGIQGLYSIIYTSISSYINSGIRNLLNAWNRDHRLLLQPGCLMATLIRSQRQGRIRKGSSGRIRNGGGNS
jgi:hypothetical protein